MNLKPDPPPGQAIADINRSALAEWYIEILTGDGRLIGSIRLSGMTGGAGFQPPGQTQQIGAGSYVVVGGNGAFLGARGYAGAVGPVVPALRVASVAEDPANSRLLGGGGLHQGIYIVPMFSPEIVAGPNGPAVFHGDMTPVTVAKPALAGETVILRMTGLGPTLPGVEPGDPFPTETLQPINSPVDVLVNGQTAGVVNSIGWPGTVGEYRIDVRIPDITAAGNSQDPGERGLDTGTGVFDPGTMMWMAALLAFRRFGWILLDAQIPASGRFRFHYVEPVPGHTHQNPILWYRYTRVSHGTANDQQLFLIRQIATLNPRRDYLLALGQHDLSLEAQALLATLNQNGDGLFVLDCVHELRVFATVAHLLAGHRDDAVVQFQRAMIVGRQPAYQRAWTFSQRIESKRADRHGRSGAGHDAGRFQDVVALLRIELRHLDPVTSREGRIAGFAIDRQRKRFPPMLRQPIENLIHIGFWLGLKVEFDGR